LLVWTETRTIQEIAPERLEAMLNTPARQSPARDSP
jgi:hypothetical protein